MPPSTTGKSVVAGQRCTTYDRDAVLAAVRACLAPLGGMAAFVAPGQRVLLKPNMLMASPPDKAASTHPALVEAAILLVKEAGGVATVGDSPAIGTPAAALQGTGIKAVCERHGVACADFTYESQFEQPDNVIARRIMLARAVAEADVIITLPKLKTHVQMALTCAVKNQFGLVTGIQKSAWHFRMQERAAFADLLIDLNRMARPALAIVDAIVAMDGDGPSSGDPFPMGMVLAGADLSALDAVACHMTGLDPRKMPTLMAAQRRGWGATSLDDIEVIGVPLAAMVVNDFRHISNLTSVLHLVPLPHRMLKILSRHFAPRPRIAYERCIRCFACRKGCPVTPPAIDPERAPHQRVNDHTCIRCYCCHEFCPAKAIYLHASMVHRLLRPQAISDWLACNVLPLIARHKAAMRRYL
jgi:uncharacterized protein (DUF362 family)/Pyruvate/2-oxoacid:ferredoxin oxidoreductase delta subunit